MSQNNTFPQKIPVTPIIFIILLLLWSADHVAADLYLPSLPHITTYFEISHTIGQHTFAIFWIGYSISHLVYGPVSDAYGRKTPLLFGVLLCVWGSLICLFSPSIYFLFLGRLLQGIGAGSCHALSRSIARDLLTGPLLSRLSAQIGMATVFVAALTVVSGGFIHQHFGWRANFFTLSLYILFIALLIKAKLPETNQFCNAEHVKLRIILWNYWLLLKSQMFLAYSLCAALLLGGFAAYQAFATFYFQHILGLTAIQFGLLGMTIALSIFIGALANVLLVLKIGIKHMLALGFGVILGAGFLMTLIVALHFTNVFIVMLPIMLYCISFGLILPNAFAGALAPFPHIAGAAGALFGCIQTLGAFFGSAAIGLMDFSNPFPLAITFITLSLVGLIAYRLVIIKDVI